MGEWYVIHAIKEKTWLMGLIVLGQIHKCSAWSFS
jgi:hypothetical protein